MGLWISVGDWFAGLGAFYYENQVVRLAVLLLPLVLFLTCVGCACWQVYRIGAEAALRRAKRQMSRVSQRFGVGSRDYQELEEDLEAAEPSPPRPKPNRPMIVYSDARGPSALTKDAQPQRAPERKSVAALKSSASAGVEPEARLSRGWDHGA